ncbi:HNH endonuclease [Arenimonas caeni]|nr:HNH endonuclease [Arenimonas caeni]
MLPLDFSASEHDAELVGKWVCRMSAAILALLPVESDESLDLRNPEESVAGLPEGSRLRVEVNRYERDRRNRAAALAIHGNSCMACGLSMGDRYGAAAAGLIEVHHTTPVSQMGGSYVVDPRTDLIPLCPNCHSVAHRRSPPFSVNELRVLVGYDAIARESDRVGRE